MPTKKIPESLPRVNFTLVETHLNYIPDTSIDEIERLVKYNPLSLQVEVDHMSGYHLDRLFPISCLQP